MGKKKGQKKGGNLDDEWKDDGTVSTLLDQAEMTGKEAKKVADAGKGAKAKKNTLETSKDLEEETEGQGDATTESIKVAAPGGKKGKKPKKTFADIDWDDELKDDEQSQQESIEQKDDAIASEPPVTGKKGKKAKKTFADIDWNDELKDDEPSPSGSTEQKENTDPLVTNTATADVGGGKKGKKKKKQKQEDFDDDMATELEKLSLDTPAPVTDKPPEPKIEATNVVANNENEHETEQVKKEGNTTAAGDDITKEGGTIRTAAQKRADKKEREKERKKKEAAKAKEKKVASTEQPAAAVTTEESADKPQTDIGDDKKVAEASDDPINEDTPAVTESATAMVDEDDKDDTKDDKKKKKKKKKDKEAEKPAASKTKKPGSSAIKKMRENLELLRLEQKKREEEELARQKAEEEAEQRRLEKVQLEQERKEKKRQKEKERRERLKKEGKLLTKAEKEKKMKTEAQMKALQEQGGGVVIPALSQKHDTGDGGVKKPVRYATRVRNKQKKEAHQGGDGDKGKEQEPNVETNSKPLEEEQETEPVTKGATGGGVASESQVPDNWDSEAASSEEEGDHNSIKDNWDDEDDDKDSVEKEETKVTQTSTVPKKEADESVTATEAEVDKDDASEEEEDEDDDDDEEEDDESSSSEEDSGEDEDSDLTPAEIARQKVIKRIMKRRAARDAARSEEAIRSPVVCVLGHVDTGKTKILDKIRHTNVQDGEAGGITQQIGATFVPDNAIREQTKFLKEFSKTEIRLPGLLIIDTPGHESFSNLRVRGSSMCDIAILVVDLMHGLEPQTIESLNLLRKKNVPFVVALNKIDRLFDWRRNPTSGVRETIKKQKQNTRDEFEERTKQVVTELAEQGINAALFWEKVNFKEYIPLVPTSAISGDGMGDLIALVVTYSQRILISTLMFSEELECIVLEVKVIAGLGTTVDVILRNGILREGDTIILSGSEGPLVVQVRALLMPQPLKELRVKNAYVTHKLVPAAQGVKITGKDLERALAGFPIFVAEKPDEVEVLKEEAAKQMKAVLSAIHTKEKGVYVQASTLGSLEALLGFLKDSKIPYSGVSIGPVHKKDVMKCSVQLERDSQWAVILAFDVRVEREAQEMADSVGVRIFTADIIYHLFDNFMKHRQELKERKREEYKHIAVFPCKLRILPDCVFNARDPIVVGVVVEGGLVKPGTPIIIPSKNCLELGVISSVEANHKQVDVAHKGQEVAIKIESGSGDAPKLYGRHFDHTDILVSKISRESIDAVKNYFREDLQKSDWQLMIELKKLLNIY